MRVAVAESVPRLRMLGREEVTLGIVRAVANEMRRGDRLEAHRLGFGSPFEAATWSIQRSTLSGAVLVHGEPMALWGVAPGPERGLGLPWAWTTPRVDAHRKTFLAGSLWVLSQMLQRYPRLSVLIDAEYTEARRWVCWLGFRVRPTTVVYGPHRAAFVVADYGG